MTPQYKMQRDLLPRERCPSRKWGVSRILLLTLEGKTGKSCTDVFIRQAQYSLMVIIKYQGEKLNSVQPLHIFQIQTQVNYYELSVRLISPQFSPHMFARDLGKIPAILHSVTSPHKVALCSYQGPCTHSCQTQWNEIGAGLHCAATADNPGVG